MKTDSSFSASCVDGLRATLGFSELLSHDCFDLVAGGRGHLISSSHLFQNRQEQKEEGCGAPSTPPPPAPSRRTLPGGATLVLQRRRYVRQGAEESTAEASQRGPHAVDEGERARRWLAHREDDAHPFGSLGSGY